jgi:hypothetical protein
MKFLKKYNQFLESFEIDLSLMNIDVMESLNILHDVLLNSIGAEQIDIYQTFSLPRETDIDIEHLSDNTDFINSLSSIGLKKSSIQNTDDFETFLNKPCKFMMIYDINYNELEGSEYMLFQTYNDTLKKWDNTKLFKMNIKGDNLQQKFFDKLTSKTIEIIDGNKNFIYTTSNGNDWQLQNIEKEEDENWKKFLRKEELQQLIDKRSVKINII